MLYSVLIEIIGRLGRSITVSFRFPTLSHPNADDKIVAQRREITGQMVERGFAQGC